MATRGPTPRPLTIWVLVLLVVLATCPSEAEELGASPTGRGDVDPLAEAEPTRVWDPFEEANRRTLNANLVIDRWFWNPLTRAYQFVVPGSGRRALRRAIFNLESPALFVNDVLQLAPLDAVITVQRFVLNSTIGLAGLFDPAAGLGLPGHHTDFGQTLALYGVPSGPYVIVPILGPNTVRDASGYVVDFMFQPTTYFLPGFTLFVYASIHQGGSGMAAREAHADELSALEASSVDFYAALRSAYYQDRTAAIEQRRREHGPRAIGRLLGLLPLGASRREIVDSAPQHVAEGRKAVALDD